MLSFPNALALQAYAKPTLPGEVVWLDSFRDQFILDGKGRPSGDGATTFESPVGSWRRLLIGHPSWMEHRDWYCDAVNGNDENGGVDAANALKTPDELQRRWGGTGRRARLTRALTLTFAQSPTGQTNMVFEVALGASFTFVGTPTITKPGTVLSDVQTQVRTAGSELGWAITGPGLDATDVGKLVVITASGVGANVDAYALVLKDETGGKVRVSPFGTFDSTTGAFTQRTPQVGDTVEIRTPMTLTVGMIDCYAAAAGSASAGVNRVLFDSLTLDAGGTSDGGIYGHKTSIYYARSILNGVTWLGEGSGGKAPHFLRGGGVGTGQLFVRSGGNSTISQSGCLGSVSVGANGHLAVAADTYFQNCGLTVARGAFVNSQGAAFFDRSSSDSAFVLLDGGVCTQLGAVPDWGTNNTGHGLKVQSGASYTYATKPTINGTVGAGREALVGGTDKLWSAIPYVEATNNAMIVPTA